MASDTVRVHVVQTTRCEDAKTARDLLTRVESFGGEGLVPNPHPDPNPNPSPDPDPDPDPNPSPSPNPSPNPNPKPIPNVNPNQVRASSCATGVPSIMWDATGTAKAAVRPRSSRQLN